jgi:general secretion pathway protein K
MSFPGRSERGFAILIVLWALVLISLIMAHVVAMARQETDLASNLRSNAALSAEADGGVYEAIFHVLDRSAAHWAANGAPHETNGRFGRLFITIRNEAAKIDLNGAPPELLAALLHLAGVEGGRAGVIAANIVAWRSQAGQTVLADEAYRAAGYPYAPPHQPFESVGELRYVLGVTPEIMERISPFLTVFHRGEVDPNGADPIVLSALKSVYGPAVEARLEQPAIGIAQLRPAQGEAVSIEVVATHGTQRLVREAIVKLGAPKKLYEILEWR